jgi:SAM-dependent methyltransferase
VSDADGPFAALTVAEGYRRHLEPVIFEPWADRLISFANVRPGQHVLDVAAGTGVVSRQAAAAVGEGGRVIASDISEWMLAQVARDDASTGIESLVCSAMDLDLVDSVVDVVLCQQGVQFFPDRGAAMGEMRRVLRPGGTAAVAVWLSGRHLDPFDTYAEVLQSCGVEDPFPGIYDMTRFSMTLEEVEALFSGAGFGEGEVEVAELTLHWDGPHAAALGMTGTPFQAGLAGLEADRQAEVMAALDEAFARSLGDRGAFTMFAVLGRGTA